MSEKIEQRPEPRFKRGDLVFYFDFDKNEVLDDTIYYNPYWCSDYYVYGLYKSQCFFEESRLFKTPLECLNACYINAQDKMIGAELELKAAQRNVEFFYNLCKEESERMKHEQET